MVTYSSLKNKNIIVTGASSGIGRETAVMLSANGANVIMIARNEDRLEEVKKILCNNSEYHVFDLTEIEKIEGLINKIIDKVGKIDGLVHCAGINPIRPLLNLKYADLHQTMLVNYYAFVELVRTSAKKKTCNPDGASMVAISSVSSLRGYKGKVPYCSSKAALDSAVRCMSVELAAKKIRVNTVSAGFIKTRLYDMYVSLYGQDVAEEDISKQPLGLGDPTDVANAVLYLLSEEAKFITGTSIVVDGGRMATD